MVYAVAWLCLLHAALATIVQDNSTDISYDGNWIEDRNNYYSGGTVHRTNISGATARYSFTGEFAAHVPCASATFAEHSVLRR